MTEKENTRVERIKLEFEKISQERTYLSTFLTAMIIAIISLSATLMSSSNDLNDQTTHQEYINITLSLIIFLFVLAIGLFIMVLHWNDKLDNKIDEIAPSKEKADTGGLKDRLKKFIKDLGTLY